MCPTRCPGAGAGRPASVVAMGERAAGTIVFRRAGPEDVGAVVELVESAYRGESSRAGWTTEADLLDGQRTDARAVGDAVGREDGMLLLAALDGVLASCCQLRAGLDGRAHFAMFAVRPDLQGRAVGSAVLAEAERLVEAEWGARWLRMEVIGVRSELIGWYERRGYERTGETAPFPYGDLRFGLPRRGDLEFVVLEKPLDG